MSTRFSGSYAQSSGLYVISDNERLNDGFEGGVRRLTVLLGGVGATGWLILLILAAFSSNDNYKRVKEVLPSIIGLALVSFLVLFAFGSCNRLGHSRLSERMKKSEDLR